MRVAISPYTRRKLKQIILIFSSISLLYVVKLITQSLPKEIIRFDLTASNFFTLSEESCTLLHSLDKTVNLYFICQNGFEDSNIFELISQYEQLCTNIIVTTIDPSLRPGFTGQFTSEELENNSVIVSCLDQYRIVPYASMYEYDTSDYSMTGSNAINVFFSGEKQITTAIRAVVYPIQKSIYALSGHGESYLPYSLQESLSNDGFFLQKLNLMQTGVIPNDTDLIIVNSPTVDISQEEKMQILDFLREGGTLLFFSNYAEKDLPLLMSISPLKFHHLPRGVIGCY